MKIFLSFSFNDQDRELVREAEDVLRFLGTQPINGRILGGEAITPGVLAKIDACDAVVGLMTRRDEIAESPGKFRTHQWVSDELNHGRSSRKPTIAFIEDGVKVEGAYNSAEHIPFTRAEYPRALLRLAANVAKWKDNLPKTKLVQLLPLEVCAPGSGAQYEYRLYRDHVAQDWESAEPVITPGGPLLPLVGLRNDEDLIQVRVRIGDRTTYESVATPQYATVELKARA